MKLNLFILIAFIMVLVGTSASFAISPNGVDLIRGAWGGTINNLFGKEFQLNLYFNEFGPDPYNPDNPSIAVTSGGISIAEHGKVKRPKVEIGPMMARYEDIGDGEFVVTIYGTAVVEETTFVIKLEGMIRTFGSGVTDDIAGGDWKTEFGNGTWTCSHLDRRKVKVPAITPEPPSGFYFYVDVYSTRFDDEAGTHLGTLLEAFTNVVAANVKVNIPGNGSVVLDPYTDVFSPNVDFVTTFRFLAHISGRPVVGNPHIFTALDIAGQPIEGVTSSDTYIGEYELDPPTNVVLSKVIEGLKVSWYQDEYYEGAFDLANGIGFNQIEVYKPDVGMVYGKNGILSNEFTIPTEDLAGLGVGTYRLAVHSFSVAPEGSGGRGLECNSQDGRENRIFVLGEDGEIIEPSGFPAPAALAAFALLQPYPAFANPETWIPFRLGKGVEVTITVYSAAGQLVRTLSLGRKDAGAYVSKDRAARWDGRNDRGEDVSSGVYFITMRAGDFVATKKMVIVK